MSDTLKVGDVCKDPAALKPGMCIHAASWADKDATIVLRNWDDDADRWFADEPGCGIGGKSIRGWGVTIVALPEPAKKGVLAHLPENWAPFPTAPRAREQDMKSGADIEVRVYRQIWAPARVTQVSPPEFDAEVDDGGIVSMDIANTNDWRWPGVQQKQGDA